MADNDDCGISLTLPAGGEKADPLIRFVVDDETGDIAHKDKSFADKIMFWKPGEPRAVAASDTGADTPAPIDAAAEDAKIKKLIGDKPVIISREKTTKFKLPGL